MIFHFSENPNETTAKELAIWLELAGGYPAKFKIKFFKLGLHDGEKHLFASFKATYTKDTYAPAIQFCVPEEVYYATTR
jgi:hypothetical protein